VPNSSHHGLSARVLGWAGPSGSALLAGVVGWGLTEPSRLRRSAYAVLLAYLWALSVAVGALVWLALGHLVGARWQLALRRLVEILTAPLPRLAVVGTVLMGSVLLGSPLISWAVPGVDRPEFAARNSYLAPWAFTLRSVAYLVLWVLLARYFVTRSRQQDQSGSANLGRAMRRASAPALLGLVLTLTFAAFDWIMSLDPGFVSAVFGLYFAVGCVVGALGALAVLLVAAAPDAELARIVTPQHYHDLGRSLYTFMVLWSYLGFCQGLLLWYANLPGERAWLTRRLDGNWGAFTLVLVAVHCGVPLFGMLTRSAKEQPRRLAFWALWLLGAHYLDLYWLVMPTFDRGGPPLGLLDLGCVLGFAGWSVNRIARAAGKGKLVSVGDPRLGARRGEPERAARGT
jgi:hypothetical protein